MKYKDKQGNPKPVRFASYIWKRIDGLIVDSLRKELEREKRQDSPDWERLDLEEQAVSSAFRADAQIV